MLRMKRVPFWLLLGWALAGVVCGQTFRAACVTVDITSNEGRIFRAGTPEQLGSDPEVKRVYLGESFSLV